MQIYTVVYRRYEIAFLFLAIFRFEDLLEPSANKNEKIPLKGGIFLADLKKGLKRAKEKVTGSRKGLLAYS